MLVPPVDRVWQLLSDPLRRPEWDPSCSAVVVGNGVEQVTEPNGTVTEHVVARSLPQEVIAWRWPGTTGRPWTKELQIRLSARGNRTVADLSMLIRGRRFVAALGRPAFTRLMWGRLRVLAQGVNQAAE